jgi:PIN domain nuclease of toxin-antitoxin system
MAGNTQFLLDTNILLTALIAPDTLPAEIQTQLSDPANGIREDFNFRPEDIQQLALETGFTELPIMSNHCHRIADLPWHLRDPFDRLLVSQAEAIPAYLLTTDELLASYSDLVRVVVVR